MRLQCGCVGPTVPQAGSKRAITADCRPPCDCRFVMCGVVLSAPGPTAVEGLEDRLRRPNTNTSKAPRPTTPWWTRPSKAQKEFGTQKLPSKFSESRRLLGRSLPRGCILEPAQRHSRGEEVFFLPKIRRTLLWRRGQAKQFSWLQERDPQQRWSALPAWC